MSLIDSYNTGDDANSAFYGTRLDAQQITLAASRTVTSIKIKAFRVGAPGIVTLSLYALDGDGHPTGDALTSGSTNGNAFTDVSPGDWYEITVTDYLLASGTQYAFVLAATGGNATNYVFWRVDGTSPSYTGGIFLVYTTFWSDFPNTDAMFEVWGYGSVDTPTNVSPADGATDVPLTPTLTASAFSGTATHASSRWQVRKADDPDWNSPTYDSGDDTVNLESITLTTGLDMGIDYLWRVRYTDSDGVISGWSTATGFTTEQSSMFVTCKLANRTLEQRLPGRLLEPKQFNRVLSLKTK